MLGDLQSPYPINMLANAWVMGITYPPGRLAEDGHIRRYGISGSTSYLKLVCVTIQTPCPV